MLVRSFVCCCYCRCRCCCCCCECWCCLLVCLFVVLVCLLSISEENRRYTQTFNKPTTTLRTLSCVFPPSITEHTRFGTPRCSPIKTNCVCFVWIPFCFVLFLLLFVFFVLQIHPHSTPQSLLLKRKRNETVAALKAKKAVATAKVRFME